MKNVIKIFLHDLSRFRNNVLAILVAVGVVIIPSLYAWFNIAASWDPYSNTNALKVAIASSDEGYEGSLIPIEMNLGDKILSALRENTQLDWIFTNKKSAIDGVKSGEYYAAIIIPKEFSNDMLSIFSSEVTHPKLEYYYNAKENAIAPKVTDKGASALKKQINEVFSQTLSEVLFVSLASLNEEISAEEGQTLLSNLIDNLTLISQDLSSASSTVNSFSSIADSTQQMLTTTSAFLQQSKQHSDTTLSSIKSMEKPLAHMQGTIDGATTALNTALTGVSDYYAQAGTAIKEALNDPESTTETAASSLEAAAEQMDPIIDAYETLSEALSVLAETYPDLAPQIGTITGKINASIETQKQLQSSLTDTAASLRESKTNIANAYTQLDTLITANSASIDSVRSDYEANVKTSLNQLEGSIADTQSTVSGLLSELDSSADSVHALSDSASSDLTKLQKTLTTTSKLFTDASSKLDKTIASLKEVAESGDMQKLQQILGYDQNQFADFMSSPVTLNTNKFYPVENYGSSMTPFYTALSIWVGGIVLVAMLKVTVSSSVRKEIGKIRPWQSYLGRYIMFLILGLLQATLICLGNLYYLRIQCLHPFLFVFAGWISSIVYVNIIYTLTVSFGDIGKAACVILLVMQVAGSGGTFPIETAPAFFRVVYPLLPFVHTMNAMRECIGGFYHATYWVELGYLSIFLLLSLALGLIFRVPLIRLNDAFTEKLEETHLI